MKKISTYNLYIQKLSTQTYINAKFLNLLIDVFKHNLITNVILDLIRNSLRKFKESNGVILRMIISSKFT